MAVNGGKENITVSEESGYVSNAITRYFKRYNKPHVITAKNFVNCDYSWKRN